MEVSLVKDGEGRPFLEYWKEFLPRERERGARARPEKDSVLGK